MPAVSIIEGHVSRAIDFYNTQNKYFSIGKTTPWSPQDDLPNVSASTSETNPPTPSPSGVLTNIVGFKKVESTYLVYPDATGELTYNGRKWKIVNDITQAVQLGARWVYLSTWLSYSELNPDISYRQIGVLTGLQKKSTVAENKYALSPAEVQSMGILQTIYNRTPVYRLSTQREQLIAIIEF